MGCSRRSVATPVDPYQRFPFDGTGGFPWPQPVNDLGLEQADNVFRKGVLRL